MSEQKQFRVCRKVLMKVVLGTFSRAILRKTKIALFWVELKSPPRSPSEHYINVSFPLFFLINRIP